MTKAIRNYPDNKKAAVVAARIAEGDKNPKAPKGIGYWAAKDALTARVRAQILAAAKAAA